MWAANYFLKPKRCLRAAIYNQNISVFCSFPWCKDIKCLYERIEHVIGPHVTRGPSVWHTCIKESTVRPSRSYKTFFSPFFFFGINLGHFTTNYFLLYVTKHKLTYEKRKNSLLAKKFFCRIGYRVKIIKLHHKYCLNLK